MLITGANGFLGTAVVASLSACGHIVRGVTRAETGALSGTTDWSALVSNVDVIVHCAARAHVLGDTTSDPLSAFRVVNRDATLSLARAAVVAGVKRLIFISSIGVNGGETFGTPFSAADVPAPHSAYAVSKYEAEQGLLAIAADTGLEVVIIRAPLVLGPNPRGNLASLLKIMRRRLPLPFGLITRNSRDLVSVTTLTNLIRVCIDHPAAAGAILLVSDGVRRTTRTICEEIARLNGVQSRFLPIPPVLLTFALTLLGKKAMQSQLLGDLEVDIRPTRLLLGWEPPELR